MKRGPKPLWTEEERILRSKNSHYQVRNNILTLFGRKCIRCGYDSDVRALQVDHIHRATVARNHSARSGHGLYIRILNGSLPSEDFQLLCANCNWLKKLDEKEHYSIVTSQSKV